MLACVDAHANPWVRHTECSCVLHLDAFCFHRKGQATNEMLFGGVSLGEGQQQQSLDVMTKTAERGLEVDLTQKK